jgi:tetratricopeptide (TPR) repeat protein
MTKNILFTGAGILLGFVVGFIFANSFNKPLAPGAGMSGATQTSSSSGALDQAEGALPPNHPSLTKDATASPSSVAATSAQAQRAMDQADRAPRSFDAQMAAAAIFYQAGAFDKALLYLNRALQLDPNNADALTALGDTKYDAGDYQSAAAAYERALAQRPNDADVRTDLGNTYFQRTPPDYERAITEYRKALQIDPKHEKTLQNLAAAALRKGDAKTAGEALDKLASVNPMNPAIAQLRATLDKIPAP